MKKLVVAAAVATALAVPAVAQEFQPPTFTPEQVEAAVTAIEDLELEEETYRDLWCGAAFIFITQYLKSQGDAASATESEARAMTLFARVETELLPQNLTSEQLNQVGANASIIAISQMGPDGEADYSEEECTAASAG